LRENTPKRGYSTKSVGNMAEQLMKNAVKYGVLVIAE
jgi:hypothetical protein